MNIQNPHFRITKIDSPYEIWILDDFLLPEVTKKINEQWPSPEDPVWFRGIPEVNGKKNILEQGMLAISSLPKMPPFPASVLEYFHSEEFTKKISEITAIEGLVRDETFRWSGMRMMIADAFQLIHSDARINPLNGKRKEVTVLCYLNEDYKRDTNEGCLEIWNNEMTECVHRIEPLPNRMVIFKCTDTSYHGVPVVKKERRMMTFSILKDAPATERYKAMFVARPFDSEDVKALGRERAFIPDAIKKTAPTI